MKCPLCGSKQVHEMRFQNYSAQVACDSCSKLGTYYEFGLQYQVNIGLAPNYEGAVYMLEQDLLDAADSTYTIAVTVHHVGNQSACNCWVRMYNQWLKFIPERVLPFPPSPGMLHGEVIRLLQSSKGIDVSQDFRWRMALIALQSDAIAMSKK